MAKSVEMTTSENTKLKILNAVIMKGDVSVFIQSLIAAIAVETTNEIVNKNAMARMSPNENNLAFRMATKLFCGLSV